MPYRAKYAISHYDNGGTMLALSLSMKAYCAMLLGFASIFAGVAYELHNILPTVH